MKDIYIEEIQNNEEIPKYIKSLLKFIYLNNYEALVHSFRVYKLGKKLIDKTDIPDNMREEALWGLLLHDVGKSIDTNISIIPTRFSNPIRLSFHFHCVFGYIISYDINPLVAKVCLYHHEDLDNIKYEEGEEKLTPEEIEVVRFVKFCDITDALLSQRSYKNRYSLDQAKKIISEHHNDIKCFENLLDSIKEN